MDRFGQKIRQSRPRWHTECETSGCWLCGRKGAGEAAAREKKIRKTKEEVFECGDWRKEDLQEVGAREEEVFDRSLRRISSGPLVTRY